MAGRLVSFWTSKDDVKVEAALSIRYAIQNSPGCGWVRCPSPDSDFRERKIYCFKISSYAQVQEMADLVESGGILIINLEGVEREVVRRVIDFIAGHNYGANGCIKQISPYIFVVVPDGAELVDEIFGERIL